MADRGNINVNGNVIQDGDDFIVNGEQVDKAYVVKGADAPVLVYQNAYIIELTQGVTTINLRSFIDANVPSSYVKITVINNLTQPSIITGNLAGLDVTFINNGEIQGTSPSSDAFTASSGLFFTNDGWIRGSGGAGGNGGAGGKGADDQISGGGSQTFTTNGTFLVPDGVTYLTLCMIGGGGGGMGGTIAGMLGGKAGQESYQGYTVTPNTNYSVTVSGASISNGGVTGIGSQTVQGGQSGAHQGNGGGQSGCGGSARDGYLYSIESVNMAWGGEGSSFGNGSDGTFTGAQTAGTGAGGGAVSGNQGDQYGGRGGRGQLDIHWDAVGRVGGAGGSAGVAGQARSFSTTRTDGTAGGTGSPSVPAGGNSGGNGGKGGNGGNWAVAGARGDNGQTGAGGGAVGGTGVNGSGAGRAIVGSSHFSTGSKTGNVNGAIVA